MAQMDPAGSKTVSPMTDYSDFSLPSSPMQSSPSRASSHGDTSLTPELSSTTDKLVAALKVAADKTATSIAHGTKQTRLEVRDRLNEVIGWVVSHLRPGAEINSSVPPVIAREYVSTLKLKFLAELETISDLNANEVVRTLIKLDEAEEAWKRTDRGKFIARLTGADCADAVVAIAHDIRSPLGSILLLVDALRHGERASPNPIRERQLGLIYSAALGLSTTVSNLIGAARGEGLVQGKPIPFSV